MANKETITCDYEGCTKPFAYRIQGFNLCHEHCAHEDQSKEARLGRLLDMMKELSAAREEGQ